MLSLFKPIPVYVKLSNNQVEITRLDTDTTISRVAQQKFSNTRLVVANFYPAEHLIREVLKELTTRRTFLTPSYRMVIQQVVHLEGGVTDIERRTLQDLGGCCDAREVTIIAHATPLSTAQALEALQYRYKEI